MILGLTISGFGIVVKQAFLRPSLLEGLDSWWSPLARLSLSIHDNDFISGQVLTFVAILISVMSYILVSLLGPRREHDLDRLLHRGEFEVEEDRVVERTTHASWLRKLGFDPEFTGRDKWVTIITLSWPLVWTVIFLVGTVYNLVVDVSDEVWLSWWRGWTWFVFGTGIVIMVWFSIGGFRDLKEMFRQLKAKQDQVEDDGRVASEGGS